MALPTPPIVWAKAAAKHPSPPPSIVPIPRFKPLLSVAPDHRYKKLIMFKVKLDIYTIKQGKLRQTCKELEDDHNSHYGPHGIIPNLLIQRIE